jgi:energy-coupling factor transport system ATP-binding protein
MATNQAGTAGIGAADSQSLFAALAKEPRPETSLEFHALSHCYPGGLHILRGLDGQARAGQITAIMGPSGSGKSTFLKKISGLLPSEGGQISLGGRDLARLPARRLAESILLVPQNPEHFFLSLTVGREWEIAGVSAERRDAVCRLFQLDLDPLMSPAMLSEGEKRRLNLALAFLDPRPVLLLDEPSYGLDRESFATLARCLRLLRDQGRTIVLVTHAPELVALCADRLYRLDQGRWQEEPV